MAGRFRYISASQRAAARRWLVRLFPVLLFLLALGPRLVAVGRYVTPDELVWVYRALQFREALLDGRWAGTLVAGHPGVTTTWLGALSMSVQLWVSPDARVAYDWLTKVAALTPDNVEAFRRLAVLLTGGRLAVAVVNSLGVVGVYWLARRLWAGEQRRRGAGEKEPAVANVSSPLFPRSPAALLAALLLALDPFLAGLSGLFHVDGLSATFVTLALLSLAVALIGSRGAEDRGRRGETSLSRSSSPAS